jgi:hypothetical protein
MREIEDYIFDKLNNDNYLKSLTGATVNDSRIYQWEPSFEPIFSSVLKAAIFYEDYQTRRDDQHTNFVQVGDIYFYFQIVSSSKDLAKQIGEYLNDLLVKSDESGFSTEHWNVKNVILNNAIDGDKEGSPKLPLYTRNISYLFSNIFRRNLISKSLSFDAILID